MHSSLCFSAALLSTLASHVTASPTKLNERQISLPPLIPSIPGVTVPLNGLIPPLPVLQVPTPPLDSEPFEVTEIRPDKVGYIWTGAGDNQHKDFLVTISLDDDTFGTIIALTDVPSSGNSPHHLGPSIDGQLLVGGGLLSLLKTQDTAFYFDTSDPYHPVYSHSNRALLASITDEIRAKPEGGFFITYMGSALGTSPGRLVETDAEGNIIHQWPEDVEGTLNILGEQFSPHGLTVDFDRGLILTSDYVVPLSILRPTLGIQRANTLRLWTLEDRKIISTITIPDGAGIQDVKFIPGNDEAAAIATAVGPGQVWLIWPHRRNADGSQGVAELLFDLGPAAKDSTAIYSDLSADGKFAYFTITGGNHVAALDISDLSNPKRLDDPDGEQPIIGPHYVKVSPDQKNLLVLGYFVQAGDISVLNTPGDYKVHWLDILDDGSLIFNRTLDFEKIFTETRGGAGFGFPWVPSFRFSFQVQSGGPNPFNGRSIQASENRLYTNLAQQNAECQGEQQNFATFYINNGEMFLFTPEDRPGQIIYVDRSNMGILGYQDVNSSRKPGFETRGWKTGAGGGMLFNGQQLFACPHPQGGFIYYVNVSGAPTPGFRQGCNRITVRPSSRIAKPVSCQYTG